MSLRDIVAAVGERERTLVLYEPVSDRLLEQVREYLAPYPLTVERRDGGESLSGTAELTDGDGSWVRTDCSDLAAPATPQEFEATLSDVLTRIDRTTFTSYDGARMASASREIEDRAWRFGRGTLHAGFQRASALRRQAEVYRRLARTDLDVHAYAVPEGDAPTLDDATVHLVDDEEIAATWFVVYDGGGDDASKCALLAEERDPDVFRGFWTYDPRVVDDVLAHLSNRYGAPA
ncbi:DICT sensory domain-containing protein [Halogeometricum luteum]|uniref:Sensor protein n=1 Tax=Halogeometricum luteum TaxID=2950537 RepID=A0ABU2FWH7_9EURY|nr:DICT sensory domain-containing protein [Halogeometricum sp. S3BR5-2]MDS0292889.1 sensor protein [Halogeometricum sp. S3BR5-2]